jgi:hypothetical protein
MFHVYFRNVFYATATDLRRATLQDAIDAGMRQGRAFDVHVDSGAVAWVWKQR